MRVGKKSMLSYYYYIECMSMHEINFCQSLFKYVNQPNDDR